MSTKEVVSNDEAIEAWNGVLFDRFKQYRHLIVGAISPHGNEGLRLHPPREGDHALDIGCGFGDTTRQIAKLVGPGGSALGIDASERFIEASREEAEAAGAENVSFIAGDAQSADLGGPFDYVFARMGTMFFANPGAAMRNVRSAMTPGGRLVMVVWRKKLDNEFFWHAEQAVAEWVEPEEDSEEPTCGPGPFSMANADTVSDILRGAGFTGIAFNRFDQSTLAGNDMDEAVALTTALGPAGEAIRLAGEQAHELRPQIEAAVAKALEPYLQDDGTVWAPSSAWIVSASAPEAAA